MARRLTVAMFLTLAFLLPCTASDFRVAIIPLAEEALALALQVEESATTWGTSIIETEGRLSHWNRRLQDEYLTESAAAIDRSYRSETDVVPQVFKKEMGLPPSATYTVLAYDHSRSVLLESGEEARLWYLHHRGYDALLLVDSERLDSFFRLSVEAFDGEMTTILDTLVQEPTTGLSLRALEEGLLRWSAGETAAGLIIEDGPSGLQASLDGEEIEHIRDPIITTEGEHRIRFSASMHNPLERTVVFEGGKIVVLSAELEAQVQDPVTFISRSGPVLWSLDGRSEGPALWFNVEKPIYPTTVIASKEGFGDRVISLAYGVSPVIGVSLKPMSLQNREYINTSQRDFYKQLRTTILLFGAYVGTLALSNTTQSPLWDSAQMATSSLALVSTVSLLSALGAYGAVSSK